MPRRFYQITVKVKAVLYVSENKLLPEPVESGTESCTSEICEECS